MGTHQAPRFCPACNTRVIGMRNTPNHILHLLLSLVTMGLWLPVWLIIGATSDSRYYCLNCGESTDWIHTGRIPRNARRVSAGE